MGLVDDDCEVCILERVKSSDALKGILEGLDGDDDNLALLLEGFYQLAVFGARSIVNQLDNTTGARELGNGLLNVGIKGNTIGHNDDAGEDFVAVLVAQADELMSRPGDGLCLAGARRMLDKIMLTRAILLNISNNLQNAIPLVVARK